MLSERTFVKLALGWIGLAFVTRIAIYPFERFSMFAGGGDRSYKQAYIVGSNGQRIFSNTLLSHLVDRGATCKDFQSFYKAYVNDAPQLPFGVVLVTVSSRGTDSTLICRCK